MSDVIEFNTAESWDFARRFASLFGAVPASFSSSIRGVRTDWDRTQSVSNGNRFLMMRLLKTSSVRSAVYFAAKTYLSEKIEDKEYLPPEGPLELFLPTDLCALIGLVYLYRRGKRLSPEDEWSFVGGPTQLATDLAGHIGLAIPAIGGSVSILAHGMWNLAYAAFLIHDKKGFIEHRRALKIKKKARDEVLEMERWGCCAYQIASVLVQSLGLGIPFAEVMTRGLSPDSRNNSALDKEAYRFAISTSWLEALQTTGKIPNIAHKGEFYPSKGTVSLLEEKAAELASVGSPFGWLDRGKEDISPDLTPQLFSAKEKGEPVSADDGGDIDEILTDQPE